MDHSGALQQNAYDNTCYMLYVNDTMAAHFLHHTAIRNNMEATVTCERAAEACSGLADQCKVEKLRRSPCLRIL